MKIYALMENISHDECLACEHGLSLYIEADGKKILFDTGASEKFAENAEKIFSCFYFTNARFICDFVSCPVSDGRLSFFHGIQNCKQQQLGWSCKLYQNIHKRQNFRKLAVAHGQIYSCFSCYNQPFRLHNRSFTNQKTERNQSFQNRIFYA